MPRLLSRNAASTAPWRSRIQDHGNLHPLDEDTRINKDQFSHRVSSRSLEGGIGALSFGARMQGNSELNEPSRSVVTATFLYRGQV